jgi:hypothetical protein
MRVPNASMGSHRMHGCSMGSVGRQTAAWVHGLRAMRAMPCVSCMHHHEAHSRPTRSSVGPWANTPQHMLMPTHALARHASRGVCQQLWLRVRVRRPEALCNSSCQTVEWLRPLSAELRGLVRVPNVSMGSHRMHVQHGRGGRQTAAWVHGLGAMRAMPCVSSMHHHEAHSRPPPAVLAHGPTHPSTC